MNRAIRTGKWLLAASLAGWAAAVAAQPVEQPALPTPANEAANGDAVQASARSDAQRRDELRSAQPLTIELFGRPTELRVGYENALERRFDFDLTSDTQRDRLTFDHELKLDAKIKASEHVSYFAQVYALSDWRRNRSDGEWQREHQLKRGQAWVAVEQVGDSPWSLQAGRIALVEPRSWWWDDDLDAVRLSRNVGDVRIETGLARELFRESSAADEIDPARKGVVRWFGTAIRPWARRHQLAAFWLVSRDNSRAPIAGASFAEDREDESDFRGRWLGMRAEGEIRHDSGHRFSYRADAALVRGNEQLTSFTDDDDDRLTAGATRELRVRGYAWDVGARWRLPGDRRPTFSLDWANGSGGQDDGSVDDNFRQTGLHENKGRVGGVKRLRYYGELLSPDLSNLRILSAGFGFRVMEKSSVEVLLHSYRQNTASSRLVGARISEDPAGESRDIGRELDLVYAVREWQHAELRFVLARFWPGSAFDEDHRDPATSFEIEFAMNF